MYVCWQMYLIIIKLINNKVGTNWQIVILWKKSKETAMYLQSAEIQNFHGIRNLAIDFEKDTTVLIGENAWGKSSLLCALSMVLGQGCDSLCTFTKDDLYIPIRLSSEEENDGEGITAPQLPTHHSTSEPTNTSTAAAAAAAAAATAAAGASADAIQGAGVGTGAGAGAGAGTASTATNATNYDSSQLEIPYAHDIGACREYLHNKGLDDIDPIKVINTTSYQRRYYSVPNSNGTGRTLHIVDFPCEQHRPLTDRWGKLSKNSSKNKQFNCHTPHSRTNKSHQKHRKSSNALDSFITSSKTANQPNYEPRNYETISDGSINSLSFATKHKAAVKKAVLDALVKGLDEEAKYEQEQPLFYKPSSEERIARAQSTLENQSELNVEGRTSAQEDIKFFSSDIYKDVAEKIVIDLIFCEGSYGQLNKVPRFEKLKQVSYLGEDGRYRIHYRVQAYFDQSQETAPFITSHQLLNEKNQPFTDSEPFIKELILLNPLLRLRDRRMYKLPNNTHYDHSNAPDKIDYHNQGVESEAFQAISHFFANITTDEDLNSARMQDAIEVLNTIASKYLTNYQSNYDAQELHANFYKPRTAREIISHPVSVASLGTLKAAVADEKPSRSKLLLSLLAGALLMSKGQREIDEFSRPILILEDIESRFHPTLLLSLWSILQVLPIQKIVTTNSSQLLSAISLHNLRRLCKQYYDVRCFRIKDKAFNVDDERKIAFHIRMSRPSALFARCWILVEGETEVWLLNEIASVLGINLASSGIKLVEFAQCGLYPLIRLARQMGINYHVLTDGDDAGRHYAQAVRDFVGSRNLPDYLSVMPHVDIEHYFYTSGFADVYQKAANIETKQLSSKHVPNYLTNVLIKDLESDPDTVDKLKQHLSLNTSALASNEAPSLPTDEANASAHQHYDSKLAAASEQINFDDFTLKNHNLDSVIKSVLSFNPNNLSEKLPNILARGKFKGNSNKAKQFSIKELSKADASKLNQYLNELVKSMPQAKNGISKKQSMMLNTIKELHTLLIHQVNRNEQRLKQLKQNAIANLHQQIANEHDDEPICAMSLDEQNKSLQQLKALAAQAIVTERDFAKAKNFERSTGKTTNAIYGALDDKELSKIGLSTNKVISFAIHKKTKPGLAILIGEAMQQRGPDSVPLLFRTMFRKLKRISQNDIGLY